MTTDTLTKTPTSLEQRYSRKAPAAADGGEDPNADAFTANRYEFGLEIQWLPAGDEAAPPAMSIEYAHFYGGVLLIDGSLILRFSRECLRLKGRNLLALFRRIKDHRQARVSEVRAGGDAGEFHDYAVHAIAVYADEDEAFADAAREIYASAPSLEAILANPRAFLIGRPGRRSVP
jgi:hypothetical protein